MLEISREKHQPDRADGGENLRILADFPIILAFLRIVNVSIQGAEWRIQSLCRVAMGMETMRTRSIPMITIPSVEPISERSFSSSG